MDILDQRSESKINSFLFGFKVRHSKVKQNIILTMMHLMQTYIRYKNNSNVSSIYTAVIIVITIILMAIYTRFLPLFGINKKKNI